MKWPFLAKSRAYYLNLARRADRRERFLQVVEPHAWLPPLMQRIEAVDGQSLAIPALPSRLIAGQARLLAEVHAAAGTPTLQISTNDFSPHLTPGAVGCALSHKLAWESFLESPSIRNGIHPVFVPKVSF